jgi:hypothetical protein
MAEQQRCAVEFCVRLGKSGSETLQLIHEAYGDDAQWRAAVFNWWTRFRDGETNVKVEPDSGRPSTAPVPLSSCSLPQTVCSTFSGSGWSVVRSASLAKGSTSKRDRHLIPTKFRFWVIRRVHDLFRRPSYISNTRLLNYKRPFEFTFHWLGPLACFESELTSGTMNPFRYFGRISWMGDRPIARSLPTQDRTTHTHTHTHKCDYTFMPWGGFEPTIPLFEWLVIILTLDRAAKLWINDRRNELESIFLCVGEKASLP